MNIKKYIPHIVFFTAFAVYIATLAPTITAGDSGELVAAAYLLGVPHPPGYPLYCLLGRLFMMAPLGDAASRMNVMSALFSAAAASLIYLVSEEAAGEKDGHLPACLARAAMALAVSFTGVYWGQAVASEVYPLQIALTLAATLALLKAGGTRDFRYACLAAFLFALSVDAHYTAVLMAPAFLFYLFYALPEDMDTKRVLMLLFFVLFGATVFLYLAPRGYANTPVNWGDPENLRNLIRHVTRASYGDIEAYQQLDAGRILAGNSAAKAVVITAVAIAIMLAVRLWMPLKSGIRKTLPLAVVCVTALFLVNLARRGITLNKIGYFIGLVHSEAWFLLLILCVAGWAVLFFRNRAASYMLGFSLITVLTVELVRTPVSSTAYLLPLMDKSYQLFITLAGVLAACGMAAAVNRLFASGGHWRAASALAAVATLCLPVWFAARNCQAQDESGYYYARDYMESILNGMEQDAAFMVEGDNIPSLLAYLKYVEMQRPDVDIFEPAGYIFRTFDDAAGIFAEGGRPIYHSESTNIDQYPEAKFVRDGMVTVAPRTSRRRVDPWEFYNMRIPSGDMADGDYGTRELVANYCYYKGMRLFELGRKDEALGMFGKSVRVGYDFTWTWLMVGDVMMDGYGRLDEALGMYEKAIKLAPGQAYGYVEAAAVFGKRGEYGKARGYLERAIRLEPKDAYAYRMLAGMYEARGDNKKALDCWQSCIKTCNGEGAEEARANVLRLLKSLGNG